MSRSRGTNVFGMLCQGIFESSAGKITWYSNMWAIVGSRWDKKRLLNPGLIGTRHVNDKGEFVETGRVLVSRMCVTNCPSPPAEDFYVSEKGAAWVPATECRKCEHHRKVDRHYRFPRCVFKKEDTPKAIATDALQQINGVVQAAVDKTLEIMGQ